MLESLYDDLNKRCYVHPDPMEFLYAYEAPGDREVVALVASSLAYGRVAQILKSVSKVLDILGPAPREFLLDADDQDLARQLSDFKHRMYTGQHVSDMLTGAARVIRQFGSLERCFSDGLDPDDQTVVEPLGKFVRRIAAAAGKDYLRLLPDPARRSACKRLNLMLRWLVRSDDVDPGGWSGVGPQRLVVPLDTHMHRIGLALGLTCRKSADLTTALEITAAFRHICPEDPVRYDFALTRLGIRKDMELSDFLDRCESVKEMLHASQS